MALCINQSGTWRVITTQCVNQSGTWRKVVTGCINDSGTWRCFGFTPPPTVTLTASPSTISQGSSSTLTWSSTNATSVTSSNFGATTVTGSTSVSPSSTTTYTITVANAAGSASANTTVTVVPPPTFNYFFASPSTIAQGSSSTLLWSTNNATAVTSSNFGATTVTGSTSVSPSSTTTYTITVRNSLFATATANTTVTVVPLPTVTISASPSSVLQGSSTTLTWNSTNATSVTSTTNFTTTLLNGTSIETPPFTLNYGITVQNSLSCTASALVTVTVVPLTVANAPLGTFIEGGNLICRASGIAWIVSSLSSEVARSWYNRNDSNTRAQQVSGCTGWFVPTCAQLRNPGYCCRTFWEGPTPYYWSSSEIQSSLAPRITFSTGFYYATPKNNVWCIRSFRCVSY